MFEKRAFTLINPMPLNIPKSTDDLYEHLAVGLDDALHNTLNNIKTASTVEAEMLTDGDSPDFDLEAEIKAHPDSLFVKCFAILADEMNDNGDFFSKEELKKATASFVGVPVFTNHQNSDAEEARGKVVHSWWNDERNGIDIIARVDAEAYPKLARGIKEEYIMGTSMGCQVQYSLCSICHNKAETPDQYCSHIQERKTRTISARTECKYHEHGDGDCPLCECKKGETKKLVIKDAEVFEYNYGIKFIENSFVVNPACHSCGVTEIIDSKSFLEKVSNVNRCMTRIKLAHSQGKLFKTAAGSFVDFDAEAFTNKVAVLNEKLPPLLKAVSEHDVLCTDTQCVKLAGQKEIESLNQALDLITTVSQSMLSQKDQLDLEFLSDLVTVLSDLQEVTDELTTQGYGRLPSPEGDQIQEGQEGQEGQEQAPMTSMPMNPTGGGGSKIHTGPAGEAGNVTSPLAQKHINLSKMAAFVQKVKKSSIDFKSKEKKRLQLGFNLKK
jgi:hypothetical protein